MKFYCSAALFYFTVYKMSLQCVITVEYYSSYTRLMSALQIISEPSSFWSHRHMIYLSYLK